MIPRYSRSEMTAAWSPETRFRIWFEIEAYAAEAMAEIGVIPKAAAKAIWEKGSKAKFDVARIDEIEKVTKHDVIAFLTHLAEFIGPDARFVIWALRARTCSTQASLFSSGGRATSSSLIWMRSSRRSNAAPSSIR